MTHYCLEMVESEPLSDGASTPSAKDRVVHALVEAAIELFGTRGPDAVSLREIAAKAQVNYGLIHHYVGTKDDLISLALRTVSAQSTERFATDDPLDTIHRLVESDPASPSLRLLAWSLLQGRKADDLVGRSQALAALAAQVANTATTVESRQRVVVLMSLLLGWQLFGDYLTESLDLGNDARSSTAEFTERVAIHIARDSTYGRRSTS